MECACACLVEVLVIVHAGPTDAPLFAAVSGKLLIEIASGSCENGDITVILLLFIVNLADCCVEVWAKL